MVGRRARAHRQVAAALESLCAGAPGPRVAELARRAVAAGAMLVVDSDSHRAEALGRQMEFGVKTARRGWVGFRLVSLRISGSE